MAELYCTLELNDEAFDNIREVLQSEVNTASNIMYNAVYEACPVRTGYMQSTIAKDITPDLEAAILVDCEYASYTEYRTHWLSNAISKVTDDIVKVFSNSIEEE